MKPLLLSALILLALLFGFNQELKNDNIETEIVSTTNEPILGGGNAVDPGNVCYSASGFGSSQYNTQYDYAGTFNGMTYYASSGGTYKIFNSVGNNAAWAMNDVMDETITVSVAGAYYVNAANDNPTDTWLIDAGAGPAGTVSIATCPVVATPTEDEYIILFE